MRCGYCGDEAEDGRLCALHSDLPEGAPRQGRGSRRGMGAVADERQRRRGAWLTATARVRLAAEASS